MSNLPGPERLAEGTRFSQVDRWLLPLAGRLIPQAKRADWQREWEAEFWHLRHGDLPGRHGHRRMEALSLARGLVADAAWVGSHALKQEQEGSAAWCLSQLAGACLACCVVELLSAGSWHGLASLWSGFFLGRFMLIAVPAVFVALATMPSRAQRSAGGDGTRRATLRRRGFLLAKVGLSVTLGFLLAVLVSIPARRALGHNSDWIDVFMSTLMLTGSLRLSLDDQKQRCQRCLRLLRQPVRVGPPSHNLLSWSGTEMACAEGHGLLQVPEIEGSWCWYDLWVEVDGGWQAVSGE